MMKFHLYVQQNQWILVTLMAGIILVILCWLTYRAMWRPRVDEQRAQEMPINGVTGFVRWIFSFVPWVVILLIIGSVVYTVSHLLAAAESVPNW